MSATTSYSKATSILINFDGLLINSWLELTSLQLKNRKNYYHAQRSIKDSTYRAKMMSYTRIPTQKRRKIKLNNWSCRLNYIAGEGKRHSKPSVNSLKRQLYSKRRLRKEPSRKNREDSKYWNHQGNNQILKVFDLPIYFIQCQTYLYEFNQAISYSSQVKLQWFILFLSPYVKVVSSLLIESIFVYIQPCVHIVEVDYFRYVCHFVMSKLQHRHTRCHIASRLQKITLLILQIFVFYCQEKPCIICTQVTDCKGIFAIGIFADDRRMVRPRIPYFAVRCEGIRIYQPCLLILKDSIKQLNSQTTDNFIITVYYHHYLFRMTKSFGGASHIRQSVFPFLIYDEFVLYILPILLLQVFLYLLTSSIN